MMGKKRFFLLLVLTFVLALESFAFAEETESFDNMMVERTKEAADVQLSLSDRGYTYNEVKEKLSAYFTDQFINYFIMINMAKESDNLYYVMGTDFPIDYIPFFGYEGNTRVIKDINLGRAAVYEFFPASTDGPVGYDDHYEAVIYTLENGVWKVKEIDPQFDPSQFKASVEKDVNTLSAVAVQSSEFEQKVDGETIVAENGIHIFRIIKSFFASLFTN